MESAAHGDRQKGTRWSSVAALAVMFVLFFYFVLSYDGNPGNAMRPEAVRVSPSNILRIVTPLGAIRVVLRPDAAPKTVEHVKELVRMGHYELAAFYRSEKSLVQGGGVTQGRELRPSPLAPVELEYAMPNTRGTVALARGEDENSGNAEFFINIRDNSEALAPQDTMVGMDAGYAVFGDVVQGIEIVEAISGMPTTSSGGLRLLNELV
eukprot:CAMPEP_0114626382 /NCGR_PEP_ID=MMETSP0168-20121206/11753_1 /TAXON_ID=95228 ORGANISM="Vannella sp., Strain DIVA3 517/6/12" /NCGR_SAMPLE_ID=MMETSP0168 /ASSEMBLY_ACC=CAM_ASM_000044 /LENGTH=208 /DNA_ID=CAMNT_0001837685 /DNA_START=71 /DNA_END=694 /DNA_ORIENTATION=-